MSTQAQNTSNFGIPSKEKEQQEPELTQAKWGQSQIRENYEEEESYEDTIKEIQNKIKESKEKLAINFNARNNIRDKISEEYLDLENERRILEIDLLNYNYAYLRNFTLHQIEENQRKENEQRHTEELQRSKQKQRKASLARDKEQRKNKIKVSRDKLEQQENEKRAKYKKEVAQIKARILGIRTESKVQRQADSEILEQNEQERAREAQESAVDTERKTRITRIESELAASRILRRSRQTLLEAELTPLYRYYPFSSLYPYSSYICADYLRYPYYRRYERLYDYSIYPYSKYWYI